MFFKWMIALIISFLLGKLMTRIHMPAILGWLIGGMILGPHALKLMPQSLLDSSSYNAAQDLLSVAVGLMLGTELIVKKLKKYGKALMITTLTQSLGTFLSCQSYLLSSSFFREYRPGWVLHSKA